MIESVIELAYQVNGVKLTIGKAVNERYLPDSLKSALQVAKGGGYVASMPDILRILCEHKYALLWDREIVAHSEEYISQMGPYGKWWYAIAHGNATLLTTPKKMIDKFEGYTIPKTPLLMSEEEYGKIRSGHQGKYPCYTYQQFIEKDYHLPRDYIVITQLDRAVCHRLRYQDIDYFKQDPLFLMRTGGLERGMLFLNTLKEVYGLQKYANTAFPFSKRSPYKELNLLKINPDIKKGIGWLHAFDKNSYKVGIYKDGDIFMSLYKNMSYK